MTLGVKNETVVVVEIVTPNNSGMLKVFKFVIPAFFFRKKGYINFVSKSVRRPSVRPSVTFLVNVSPPKPLEVATSNFVVE